MTGQADRPPGVDLQYTEDAVIAHHAPTGVICRGESVADALRWLAEGVALHLGDEGDVSDPEAFLADATARLE